jgi:hypothetical protein
VLNVLNITIYVIEKSNKRCNDQIIRFTYEKPPTLSFRKNNEVKEKINAPNILPAA